MVIFDNDKYLENIKKEGIGATDIYARKKMQLVMSDLVQNSTYKRNKILEKVKTVATEYFHGLPDDLVNAELADMYERIREKVLSNYKVFPEKKIITLYEKEMEMIAELKDEKLMSLAFGALVLHKFCGQYIDDTGIVRNGKAVYECNADIFRVAHLNGVSGTNRNKMLKELSDRGYIRYFVETNSAYRFTPDWIANTKFTVPFNVDIAENNENEKVFMQVTNYDDVFLYWRYFMNDEKVILCEDCGCPIEKTAGAKALCSECAAERTRENKRKYKQKMAFA